MNEQLFSTYMQSAKSLHEGDYLAGYLRGLRRFWHGENFGEPGEHEKWMAMSDHRQDMGDGYRDGFAGKPPRGAHGNTGNKNAEKDVVAGSHLHIRITAEKKARYVRRAQIMGLKLSDWVVATLDSASDD